MNIYNPEEDILVDPCRCPQWAHRCVQRITEEDLRCDTCRAGCIQTTVRDTAGNATVVGHCSPLLADLLQAEEDAIDELLLDEAEEEGQ